jgi:hypothetical protein
MATYYGALKTAGLPGRQGAADTPHPMSARIFGALVKKPAVRGPNRSTRGSPRLGLKQSPFPPIHNEPWSQAGRLKVGPNVAKLGAGRIGSATRF